MQRLFFFLIFLSFTFSFIFPILLYAQEDPKLQVPGTIEEVKEDILHVGDKIIGAIPEAAAALWKNEVAPVWKAMWNWTKAQIWQSRVKPAIETLEDKIKELLGKKVEKQKPLIEQELKKEKQELEQDIKTYSRNAGKGLWERFNSLFSEE